MRQREMDSEKDGEERRGREGKRRVRGGRRR